MKIKLLGIELKTGKGVSLADMFQSIQNTGGDPVELGGHSRFVYVDIVDDFHVGLVITTKDHSKFLEFKHDKASAKLETRDVTPGSQLADFNFFAINKTTGKGIYQYYHHSCSVNMFGLLCKNFYEKLKWQRIDDAKRTTKNLTRAEETRIKKNYSGTLTWEILVRQEAFERMISELSSIRAVTLSVSTLAYNDTVFSPLALVAKNMSQRFTFGKGTGLGSIVSSILKVANLQNVDGAKVEGVDGDGLEQIIKMYNTPDQFGEYDFDEIAETMTISPVDFAKSEFLKDMIKVAKGQPVISEIGEK